MISKIKAFIAGINNTDYKLPERVFRMVFLTWMTYLILSSTSLLTSTVIICLFLLGLSFAAIILFSDQKRIVSSCLMLLFSLICSIIWITGNYSINKFITCTVFITVVSVFIFGTLSDDAFYEKKSIKWPFIILIAIFSIFFAVYSALITCSRYFTFRTPTFDFGIFAQAFYSLKEKFVPLTTCERGYELSHFAVHMSPCFYLLLPFYILFPYPATIQIMQSLVLAVAVIPLYFICRNRDISIKKTATICIMYLIHPALVGGCMYDFHENCMLPLTIFLFILAAEKNKMVFALLSVILTCSVKEDAAIYIIILCLFMLLFYKKEKKILPAASLGLSLICFALSCWYINKHGLGIMTYRYANVSTNGSLTGVIIRLIKEPLFVLNECFDSEKIEFLFLMLLPLGLLPLITRDIRTLILSGGLIAVNLVPDYVYQHSINFQYVFGPLALLIYACVINISKLNRNHLKRGAAAVALSSAILYFAGNTASQTNYVRYNKLLKNEISVLNEAIDLIPDGASVSATTFILANVSNRSEVYSIEDKNKTDYAIIDLRYAEWNSYVAEYKKMGYKEIFRENGIVVVLESSD